MTRCLVSLVLSHLLALSTAWSPAVASPRHASRRHARARVVADAALADRAHELYRTLLIDGRRQRVRRAPTSLASLAGLLTPPASMTHAGRSS